MRLVQERVEVPRSRLAVHLATNPLELFCLRAGRRGRRERAAGGPPPPPPPPAARQSNRAHRAQRLAREHAKRVSSRERVVDRRQRILCVELPEQLQQLPEGRRPLMPFVAQRSVAQETSTPRALADVDTVFALT